MKTCLYEGRPSDYDEGDCGPVVTHCAICDAPLCDDHSKVVHADWCDGEVFCADEYQHLCDARYQADLISHHIRRAVTDHPDHNISRAAIDRMLEEVSR